MPLAVSTGRGATACSCRHLEARQCRPVAEERGASEQESGEEDSASKAGRKDAEQESERKSEGGNSIVNPLQRALPHVRHADDTNLEEEGERERSSIAQMQRQDEVREENRPAREERIVVIG